MNKSDHNQTIIEQFTKQAAAYTAISSHNDAVDKLISITAASMEDIVLDVACGSGIVSLAFAQKVKQVVGIDITPEMIEEAKKSQAIKQLKNIEWELGLADTLPFADATFSIVVTRFSFHHFEEPQRVLSEMVRVCKPGGHILVADVAVEEAAKAKYDEMEKLRDPSHHQVLCPEELELLFLNAGLKNLKKAFYPMQIELEKQLQASFPTDKEKLRNLIMEDIGQDKLGIKIVKNEETTNLVYPIHILTAVK